MLLGRLPASVKIMEQEIVNYLKDKYNPEVILLAGSRAKGTEKDDSDWDLFLLNSSNKKGGFFEFENEILDITIKDWPNEGSFLTIPFGPLWPVKILYNASGERLQNLLKVTEEAHKKGPMDLYKDSVLERFQKLNRWQKKLVKYSNEAMVEFFYAGVFYEFAIRAWFELQNKWPLSLSEAISIIKEKDNEFFIVLQSFITAGADKRISIAEEALKKLSKFF